MLWGCVPRVCGGKGGCAGGGVPLGAVPALSWCGEVSLGGILIIIIESDACFQVRLSEVLVFIHHLRAVSNSHGL